MEACKVCFCVRGVWMHESVKLAGHFDAELNLGGERVKKILRCCFYLLEKCWNLRKCSKVVENVALNRNLAEIRARKQREHILKRVGVQAYAIDKTFVGVLSITGVSFLT